MESIDRIVDQSAVSAFPTITIDTVVSNIANIVNDNDSKEVSNEVVAKSYAKTDEITFTNQNLPIEVTSYIKYQRF